MFDHLHPSVQRIADHVASLFEGEGTGHDWFHIERVTKNAIQIAAAEGADPNIAALGALLHDIADWKFHGGSLEEGPKRAKQALEKFEAPEAWHEEVVLIVARVSFKGAGVADNMPTLAGKCVQDADRLDAIGAIGVARTFAYGGSTGQPLYDPALDPELHADFAAYRDKRTSTINHFHEKLLLLKDRMHTATGKAWAEERHQYMEDFLQQFHREWNAEPVQARPLSS